VTDILFSLSASAPTMPTNYDARRLIGSILTNASSQFVPFDQLGEEFIWRDPVADVAVSNLSTASVSYTLTVPTGLAVTALIFGGGFNASANVAVYVRSLTQTDTAPSNTFYTFKNPVANSQAGSQFAAAVVTNTSAQIAARASAASTSLNILTRGFIHPRGRNA
jgi:hypothetical protein